MAAVHFDGGVWETHPGESVLDCLLRNGFTIPHSCKVGVCGSCTLRASGTVAFDQAAQEGMKETFRLQGFFHSCSHRPAVDIEVSSAADELESAATIVSLDMLSPSVIRVRLKSERDFDYFAGQYAVLMREDGLARSYSLASLPEESELEMHVRLLPGGRMSGWLANEARPGVAVRLRGPTGTCFYTSGTPDQTLILAGAGTGLSPLYGILRDALQLGHTGHIHLFHGARDVSGLYLTSELREIAAQHGQVFYTACLLEGEPGPGVAMGALDQIIKARVPKLAGCRAWLCGDPELVRVLKKKLFLAGMALNQINADLFLPAAS